MRRSAWLFLLLLPGARLAGQSSASARAQLFRADLDLSTAVFDSGVVTRLPAALGEDGVLVWPGAAVIRGHTLVSSFFSSQPLLMTAHFSWQPLHIEISADSTLGLLFGVATLDRVGDTSGFGGIHRIGRYLAAWKRVNGVWQLESFALANLIASDETVWRRAVWRPEMDLLPSSGPAGRFIAADSSFAADAGTHGVSMAFGKWATPDATTFSGTGELNIGSARVAAVLASNKSHWEWGAVAAGASTDGTLGWTVGQAVITPPGAEPIKSKYLTLWRKMPDGSIRFIADGGSGRP